MAFLIVGALSLVLPPLIHRDTALREFRWMIVEPLLFFALIARFVRTEDDMLRAINAFLIAAAVGGSIGAQQFLYGETWSMEGVGRATGVWPGATAFGIFMGRALPLAVVLALFLPRDSRTLAALALGLCPAGRAHRGGDDHQLCARGVAGGRGGAGRGGAGHAQPAALDRAGRAGGGDAAGPLPLPGGRAPVQPVRRRRAARAPAASSSGRGRCA